MANLSKYWQRRKEYGRRKRNRRWKRDLRYEKETMLRISNLYGPCPECGHKHWPCRAPCFEILCGGACRNRMCKCMKWGQFAPRSRMAEHQRKQENDI